MSSVIIDACWNEAPEWANELLKTRSGRFIFSNGTYFMGGRGEAIKHGSVIDTLPCGHEILAFDYESCEIIARRILIGEKHDQSETTK